MTGIGVTHQVPGQRLFFHLKMNNEIVVILTNYNTEDTFFCARGNLPSDHERSLHLLTATN